MTDKREEFIAKFVASFLAAYAAGHYIEYCMLGKATKLADHPIEDAIFLAKSAWDQFVEKRPTAQ